MHRLLAVSIVAIIVIVLLVYGCKQNFAPQDRVFGIIVNPKPAARRIF